MKRIFSFIMLLLLICIMTVPAFAAGSSGDIAESGDSLASESPSGSEGLTYAKRDGYYSVTGYTGRESDVVIPKRVNGIEVRYIESHAFYDRAHLEGFSFSSTGNCIGNTETKTLVAGCNNSVIPDDGSITAIGAGAFKGMNGLTEVKIPDGVQTTDDHAFEGCITLTSVVLPDSVKKLGFFAFNKCGALSEFTASARNLAVELGFSIIASVWKRST